MVGKINNENQLNLELVFKNFLKKYSIQKFHTDIKEMGSDSLEINRISFEDKKIQIIFCGLK